MQGTNDFGTDGSASNAAATKVSATYTPDSDSKILSESDNINPKHYRAHLSGIECIDITRYMNFNLGNAIKYIWRVDLKGDPIENLKKAHWYLEDEIKRRAKRG